MKKYLIIICAALGMTACVNDWDTVVERTDVFTAENVGEPNTTIAAVRARYAKTIESGSTTEAAKVTEDLIIEGIVTANDISGNLYQNIVIQDVKSDGTVDNTQGGIQVAIKGIGSLAAVFPVGQKIRVNLNGLCVSGYGKMPRIGQPYVNTNGALRHGPMPPGYVKTNIQLVGSPFDNLVKPAVLTKDMLSGSTAVKDYTPMLVVIQGCTISEADGEEKYAYVPYGTAQDDSYSVEHTIKMADGGRVTLYTSTSATFAQEVMPKGKLTIYGLLARYNDNFQLILRSLDDVVVEK